MLFAKPNINNKGIKVYEEIMVYFKENIIPIENLKSLAGKGKLYNSIL